MRRPFSVALSIVLLGVFAFSLVGNVKTAEAANFCNAAQFVSDVTIPDGTYINPGASFTKTWRIKNIGTCAWNTSYSLIFVSGERMGGLSPIFLSRFISPGKAVDLTVDLTAPFTGGGFRGYWQLQSDSGSKFGIGSGYRNPFWVDIRVLGQTQAAVAYDFIANMCSALWVYDGGPISCPVNNNKRDLGYVIKLDNPTLENGMAAGSPALLTVPTNKFNGLIQGIFPIDDVFRGDHFQATIGCQYGAVNCAVTYQLEYRKGGTNITLWKFREQYDGLFEQVDIDLSPIADVKDAKLVLSIYAAGPAVGDQPLWVAPRIVRNVNAPVVTPTPIPPTAIPPSSTPPPIVCTDRAQFITDVNVPDGTIFAPNQTFNKIWRLRNVGTCTWTTAYSLAFVSGDRMGGADTLFAQTVSPGQTGDLAVNLTAPSQAGSYRGFWELKNSSGTLFGIGAGFDRSFWVDIKVAGTAVATSTAQASTSTTAAATPTATTAAATPTSTTAAATPTATAKASGWNLYQNTKYAFAFQIPPGATISNQSGNGGHVDLPIITAGTNLGQKYLEVGVAEGAAVCKSPWSDQRATSQNVTINGIQFFKEVGTGNAMNNVWDYTAYSTAKGNACISLTFFLHSVNLGVFETPPPAFDPVAESAIFSTMMSTYGNQ
jgi:hypothetical protein